MIMDFNKSFRFQRQDDWVWTFYQEQLLLNNTINDSNREDRHTTATVSSVNTVEKLKVMKNELNEIKEKLNIYEIIEWGKHTSMMDPASKVVKQVSSTIKPRPFCTNAWCKFYEMLAVLRVLDKVDISRCLCSVHLCEAPGGFICALNHYIRSERPDVKRYKWLANTLNPYNELCEHGQMIPDDRDDTGDLTKQENISSIVEEVNARFQSGLVDLVTCDGSIDCQLNPGEQEKLVYPLILSEVLTVFQILRPGGSAIIKMFTMFEPETLSLLYFLNLTFNEVVIHKPATSKPGNSEVYVVCFEKQVYGNDDLVELLKEAHLSRKPVIDQKFIPQSFTVQHIQCVEKFKAYQTSTILRNIEAFDGRPQSWIPEHERFAEEYIQTVKLKPIALKQSLTSGKTYSHKRNSGAITDLLNCYGRDSGSQVWNPRKRRLSGTFNQRLQNSKANRLEEIMQMKPYMTQEVKFIFPRKAVCPKSHAPSDVLEMLKVVTTPSPVTRLSNSCFCESQLLNDFNAISESRPDILYKDVDIEDVRRLTEFTYNALPGTVHEAMAAVEGVFPIPDGSLIVVSYSSTMASLSNLIFRVFPNCYLVLHNVNCLTRFGAGIVFLLWHLFDEVAVVGHNSKTNNPSLLFKRCKLSYGEAKTVLRAIDESAKHIKLNETIVELFPTPSILECSDLHRFICDVCNECLRRAINALVLERNNCR